VSLVVEHRPPVDVSSTVRLLLQLNWNREITPNEMKWLRFFNFQHSMILCTRGPVIPPCCYATAFCVIRPLPRKKRALYICFLYREYYVTFSIFRISYGFPIIVNYNMILYANNRKFERCFYTNITMYNICRRSEYPYIVKITRFPLFFSREKRQNKKQKSVTRNR